MAHEELMRDLPKDIKRTDVPGPFLIRRYPGSFAVVVLTDILVTCGGDEAESNARQLAEALNRTWNGHYDNVVDNPPEEGIIKPTTNSPG